MIRLFAAIDIPEDVRAELARLQQGLPGARWSPPHNMHITLAFIGEQPEPVAEDVALALQDLPMAPFTVAAAGIGTFGGERQNEAARVLYAGVEHDEALPRLAKKVETAVRREGIVLERRKYHPHITLARIREQHPDKLAAYIQAHALFRSRPFSVSAFTLYESVTGKEAPAYHPLMRYPLA